MKCAIKFIFLFIIFVAIIPFTYSLSVKTDVVLASSCSEDNTVLKLSNETNAHAALYDDTNYDYALCYGASGAHTCTGSNIFLRLSSMTNAHAEVSSESSNYEFKACFGELTCNYIVYSTGVSGGCLGESRCFAKLSGLTNAHVSNCDSSYPVVICCNEGGAPPAPTDGGGESGGTPGGGGGAGTVDTDSDGIPDSSDTDDDNDGINDSDDDDDDGDGILDEDESSSSCNGLNGILCNGVCSEGSYFSNDAVETNCCISDTGLAGCSTSTYIPLLEGSVRFDKTCLQDGKTQIGVVYTDTGELVNGEDLAALGLDPTKGNPYIDLQDYSCGSVSATEGGEAVPGYGIVGMIFTFGFLFIFYCFKRKI